MTEQPRYVDTDIVKTPDFSKVPEGHEISIKIDRFDVRQHRGCSVRAIDTTTGETHYADRHGILHLQKIWKPSRKIYVDLDIRERNAHLPRYTGPPCPSFDVDIAGVQPQPPPPTLLSPTTPATGVGVDEGDRRRRVNISASPAVAYWRSELPRVADEATTDETDARLVCTICAARVRHISLGCGHITCAACATRILEPAAPTCPTCRVPITVMHRVHYN